MTTPRNIDTLFEARLVLFVLSEMASRLKEQCLQGCTVSLYVRDTDLKGFTRQRKCVNPTNISNEILEVAIKLLSDNYFFEIPLRSIGVSVSGLFPEGGLFQLDLFSDPKTRELNHKIDETMDILRNRYGASIVQRASLLMKKDLTSFNPKDDHVIHPLGYF